MKRSALLKIFCALLAFSAVFAVFGSTLAFAEDTTAGDGEEETPKYAAIDLLSTDLTPYVKLGQYEDIEITLNIAVSDEELYKYAVSDGVYTEVKSRETKDGDLVSIEYVGNVRLSNGNLLPVRGGSSSGAVRITLDLDGEDGETIEAMLAKSEALVGVKPGNTAEVAVNMPEDYPESAMAGKEIVFVVSVGAIIEYGYTDEYVSSKYGCATVEDYKLIIMKEKLKSFTELLIYDTYLHIVKNATVLQYPTEHYNYYYDAEYTYYKSFYDGNESYQTTYGSFEKFLAAVGTSIEQIEQSAKIRTEKDLICAAIYKTGILGTVSESEYESRLAQIAADNNMTVANLELMYSGRFDIQNLIIVDYTYDNLTKLVKLTTDYSEYEYLLDEIESTTPPLVTPPVQESARGIDSNIILMIVIIAVGFIGIVVLFVLSKKAKKPKQDEVDEYNDEEYDEDEEEYEDENSESDEDDGDNEDSSKK